MKVKSINVGKLDRIIGGATVRGAARSSASSGSAAPKDTASISSQARVIGQAGEAVRNAPKLRMERVQPIKDALESGRYDVASLDVADKILRQVLMEGKQAL